MLTLLAKLKLSFLNLLSQQQPLLRQEYKYKMETLRLT